MTTPKAKTKSEACFAEMPKGVKVGAHTYRIEVKGRTEGNADGEFGRCQFFNQKIFVTADQSPQALTNTVLHEVMHAIHWEYGLHDKNTEEEFSGIGTNGLLAMWKDNPRLIAWISKWNGVTE